MLTRHYLYFPTRSSAEKAAATVPQSLKVDVSPGATGADWLLLAEHEVTDPGEIDAVEANLIKVATSNGGEYDGHETRLLGLLVDGHNYRTAATELGVSVNTIAFHMRNIYDKLEVHSKSEAVAKALRQRLVR